MKNIFIGKGLSASTIVASAAIVGVAPLQKGRINQNLVNDHIKHLEKTLKCDEIDLWYIKDLCLLGLVRSIADISKDGNSFDGEVKAIHKNKDRKARKKVNSALEEFTKLRDFLMTKLNQEQRQKLQKITDGLAPIFFEESKNLKLPNLELIAAYLLYIRFVDERAKTPNEDFKICTDTKKIFSIVTEIEKINIKDEGQEYRFALNLVKRLNKVR